MTGLCNEGKRLNHREKWLRRFVRIYNRQEFLFRAAQADYAASLHEEQCNQCRESVNEWRERCLVELLAEGEAVRREYRRQQERTQA